MFPPLANRAGPPLIGHLEGDATNSYIDLLTKIVTADSRKLIRTRIGVSSPSKLFPYIDANHEAVFLPNTQKPPTNKK